MDTIHPSTQALLDVFHSGIQELILIIQPLSTDEIISIRDRETQDEDCISIQSILEHVIYSGYCYTHYYQTNAGYTLERPIKTKYGKTAEDFIVHLKKMYNDCAFFFKENPDLRLIETDSSKKIETRWGQQYDIDQLFEHSIVHILRHKRQIQNFLKKT